MNAKGRVDLRLTLEQLNVTYAMGRASSKVSVMNVSGEENLPVTFAVAPVALKPVGSSDLRADDWPGSPEMEGQGRNAR